LRCSASERGGTSEFASKLIGQREVLHTTRSTTRRSGEWSSATTKSEQLRIEPAIMASEIERLPDLAGFLKIASLPDWQVATLTMQTEVSMPRARSRRVRAITPDPPSVAPSIESTSPGTPAIQRPMRKPRARTKSASAQREPAPLPRRVKPAAPTSQDSDTPNSR
jgi:hypothetical protein